MSDRNELLAKGKEVLLRRDVMVMLAILLVLAYLFFTRGSRPIMAIFIEIAIFGIITMSLNLETGFTGIPQFGRVAAVIAGAFVVGAIPGRIMAAWLKLPSGVEYAGDQVNVRLVPQLTAVLANNWFYSLLFLIVSLAMAALGGALVGWLISRPAIRLREGYLGISLLAFGDILMWVGHNAKPLVGGSVPVYVPDPFRIFNDRYLGAVIVLFTIAILVYMLINRLVKSPFGRTLKMMRDNEMSASAAGKSIVQVRTRSLVIGSAIAAIGGALYVINAGAVSSITFTRLSFTFWPWAYMMLGGIGSNIGVFLGVASLATLRYLITVYRTTWFGFLLTVGIDPTWLEYTLIGAVIVIVILFLPHGLVPAKIEPTLSPSRVKKIMAKREQEVV